MNIEVYAVNQDLSNNMHTTKLQHIIMIILVISKSPKSTFTPTGVTISVCPIRVLKALVAKSLMAPSTATRCIRSARTTNNDFIYCFFFQ